MDKSQLDFFNRNYKLVSYVFNKLIIKTPNIISLEQDLLQEGYIALIYASKTYKKDLNISTETNYCIHAIRNNMITYIKRNIKKYQVNFNTMGVEDYDENFLSKDGFKIVNMLSCNPFQDIDVDAKKIYTDLIQGIDTYYDKKKSKSNILKKDVVKDILNMYLNRFTYKQIGNKYNITYQRVQQILKKIFSLIDRKKYYIN